MTKKKPDFLRDLDTAIMDELTGGGIKENAAGLVFVTICTAKAVLIITAPVWILPYAIWRKGVSSEIQTVEKELQEKNME